jgi:hypothetical protein
MSSNSRGLTRSLSSVALFIGLQWTPALSFANDHETAVQELKAQLQMLIERLEELESQQQSIRVITEQAATAVEPTPKKTARTIKTNADLRYRFESFDIAQASNRHRNRVRARVGIKATVNDTTLLGFELASGSDDPISTNQTLGDDFSSKQVNIDQAYARWQPKGADIDVYAGKFKNPLFKVGGNGLIWDGDLRPEGFAVKYARDNLFANAMGTWVNESKSGDDVLLLGAQGGLATKAFQSSALVAGLGYYQYTGIENSGELIPAKNGGNRLTDQGRYLSAFDLLEGFIELETPTGLGKTTVYANYVKNLGADDYDSGYVVGAKLSVADWGLGWAYQDIEADAVYARLTDSDFAGGGTDSQGHKLSASYSSHKNAKLAATLFLNDQGMDFGDDNDYRRFMLDLSIKY